MFAVDHNLMLMAVLIFTVDEHCSSLGYSQHCFQDVLRYVKPLSAHEILPILLLDSLWCQLLSVSDSLFDPFRHGGDRFHCDPLVILRYIKHQLRLYVVGALNSYLLGRASNFVTLLLPMSPVAKSGGKWNVTSDSM